MLLQLVQHRQHGDVRLSGAGGRADEQVLVAGVGRLEHDRLDAVQRLGAAECFLSDLCTTHSVHTTRAVTS